MTDKEKLENLLKEFGIGYNLNPDGNYIDHSIVLEADYGNVEGYPGFIAGFKFDSNGKFEYVGVWE